MGRIGRFGHVLGAGEADLCGWERRFVVAFRWGLVSDALVGALQIVIVDPQPDPLAGVRQIQKDGGKQKEEG